MLVPVLPVVVPAPAGVPAGVAALTSPADAGAAVWFVLQATMPSASAVLASVNFQRVRDIRDLLVGLVYFGGVVLAGGGWVAAGCVLVVVVVVCAPPPTEPFAASCCWTA